MSHLSAAFTTPAAKDSFTMTLNFAVVCSSNMNRSMETHSVLAKKKFSIASFGTGSQIKIPGKRKLEPNCYPFGKNRSIDQSINP